MVFKTIRDLSSFNQDVCCCMEHMSEIVNSFFQTSRKGLPFHTFPSIEGLQLTQKLFGQWNTPDQPSTFSRSGIIICVDDYNNLCFLYSHLNYCPDCKQF